MNVITTTTVEARKVEESYLADRFTVSSWLLSTDHKRIGILYAVSITLFFLVGAVGAAMIRWNLISPAGMLRDSETYNRMFTLHAVVMVWFFLVPSIPATLGNFFIPLMIGARDLAFPKLNLMSWYVFMFAAAVMFYALFVGGVDVGWTFYPTLSTGYSTSFIRIAACGIFLVGFSSILTGLNFIITIHTMRAPGMTWHRLPVFCWSHYATSMIFLLATPVLAMDMILLFFQRQFGVGFFDPRIGGDLLLYQHLFWFYSHPAVYIMILPGMGVVTEIVPCFCHKKLFGYEFVVWCSISIAVLGFFVWGHHMFVAGESQYSAIAFSLMSYVIAVPSAIKVFNWVGTMHKGFIRFDAPMLYAIGFIGLFTIGGLTGLWLANLAADVQLNQTYFVVAHFHYVMVGGMVSAFFAGIHFWWPKITGKMYPEMWGRAAALIIFLGFNMTFAPQFVLGFTGMPRRYATYPPQFHVLNVMSSAGASVLALGYILPLFYLIWSLFYGEDAPANPWDATGLEWQTSSPPPAINFLATPVVTSAPYQYKEPEVIEQLRR
jgi:cytochrome c oxidase subunit 1